MYFELNRPRVLKSLLWQLCQFGSQDQDNPIPSLDCWELVLYKTPFPGDSHQPHMLGLDAGFPAAPVRSLQWLDHPYILVCATRERTIKTTATNIKKIHIVIKNCHQKLSSKIVIKRCHQKLSLKIVIKNCGQKLSSKISLKKCHQKLTSKMS